MDPVDPSRRIRLTSDRMESLTMRSWSDRWKGFSMRDPISRRPKSAHTTTDVKGTTRKPMLCTRQSGSAKHQALMKRVVNRT